MLPSHAALRLEWHGLVITPLHTPRRFNPLAQPLEASQKLGGRELVWNFNGGDITSDGGALVLKKLEERTRIVRRFAACFTDYRNPKLIEHPLLDLIAQRVFGLALGYEDLNDHDEYRRFGRFGGGVGARPRGHPGAHSPALAGGGDSVAGRRRFLPREVDGVVRVRGYGLYLRAGAECAVEETDRRADGASGEAIRANQSARPGVQ